MDTQHEIRDFTHHTCTNLMLKLKILFKKLKSGDTLHFYSNREQHDNIQKPFSKPPFSLAADKVDDNKYHIKIMKE